MSARPATSCPSSAGTGKPTCSNATPQRWPSDADLGIVRRVALLTSLPLADATRLGREFGLEVQAIEPLSAGSVNSNFALTTQGGRRYFARLYEEQGREGALAEL